MMSSRSTEGADPNQAPDAGAVGSERRETPAKGETIRVDVWLVAVRLTKTRSEAAKACRSGHVEINGQSAKPASAVAIGDRIEINIHRRVRIVEIVRLIGKRTSAPIAHTCYLDHSPPVEPRSPEADFAVRAPGAGRPTKRDRRRIDRLRGR